jgi:hypothetical protein
MAIPLLVLGFSSLLLATQGPIYAIAAGGQVLGYGLAAAGLLRPGSGLGRSRPAGLAAFFVMINVASLHALVNLVTGRRIERWEPSRVAGGGDGTEPETAGAAATGRGPGATRAAR